MSRILVVDDDSYSSHVTIKRLENEGIKGHYCGDGVSVQELIAKEQIDLVLLDINMPNTSGLDILTQLRHKFTPISLPIIMVTSSHLTSTIVEALNKGAIDYITKLLSYDVLIARVKTHLNLKILSEKIERQAELATASAMVVTYNHEINNPLTTAMGFFGPKPEDYKPEFHDKIYASLERIRDIVKKIKEIPLGDLTKDTYSADTKLYKLG